MNLTQEWDIPLAESQEITNLIDHFDQIMKEVEFYDQENPRQLLTRVKRFFRRSGIDHMESNPSVGFLAYQGLSSSKEIKLHAHGGVGMARMDVNIGIYVNLFEILDIW